MSILSRKIGIDLGSSATRIIVPKKGVVLDQPSIVARDQQTNKVVAVGESALEMVDRTPESTQTEYPLKRGVIADFGVTARMLKEFLSQATGRLHLARPEVMVTVSMTATSTEQRAVIEAAEAAGAQQVHLIQPPVAAALGSNVVITKPHGAMIIDIGAGTTEIAVISLGGIISQRAIRTGSNAINEAIRLYLRRNFGIFIGPKTAEAIKLKIGHIGSIRNLEKKEMEIHGRSTVEGIPKTITLTNHDMHMIISPVFEDILRSVRSVIEHTPAELVADIKKNGLLISGGGALLSGLEGYLSERLNTACSLVDNPAYACARGTQLALQHIDEYQKSLLSI